MAKRKVAEPEVIDVAPENPELALATREGGNIASFVAGLQVFFHKATDLERQASIDLELARTWEVPKSQQDDETLVRVVRSNNEAKKEIEDHWQITAVVHKFHRHLTAHRERAVKLREEVATIGTSLHNRYVAEERRRAEEEERARQAEADRRAAQERERVLADLEAAAIAAEAVLVDLSERETSFVDYYFRTGNAPQAARLAGYQKPDEQALRLVKSAKIQTALKAKQEAQAMRYQVDAQRAMPVMADTVPEVRPQVAQGADRTTKSAELFDEKAFINAVLSGNYNIPIDVLTVRQPVLNDLARRMGEQINQWPGVRIKTTTRIV